MIAILFLLAVVSGQDTGWPPRDRVLGYRPTWVPSVAKELPVVVSNCGSDSYRGYSSVRSTFVLKKPLAHVNKALSQEFAVVELESSDGRVVHGTRVLSDRFMAVSTSAGRLVTRQEPTGSRTETEDRDSYSTIVIYERPLYVGPMPRNWPTPAKNGLKLPRRATYPPLAETSRPPDSFHRQIASAAVGYRMLWVIKEPIVSAGPRIRAAIEGKGKWKIRSESSFRDSSSGFWAEDYPGPKTGRQDSRDNPPRITRIHVYERGDAEVPKGYTIIDADWWDGSLSDARWRIRG